MPGLDSLNFLVTNYIPRRAATRFIRWFGRIENPIVRDLSLWIWGHFSDELKLDEARSQSFKSLHECFIRQLKPGARPVDRRLAVIISPCDAVVGANGKIEGDEVFQVKGSPYRLADLLTDSNLVSQYQGGTYVTLRLKSSMYHHFHAPCDCRVASLRFIPGDCWNVNPPTLKRVESLYCKNERAVIPLLPSGLPGAITLVPVAAILVASLKLHCLHEALDMRYSGPLQIDCDATYGKGDEMGYFQHGSTIVVLATAHYSLIPGVCDGDIIRMGQPLLGIEPGSGLESKR